MAPSPTPTATVPPRGLTATRSLLLLAFIWGWSFAFIDVAVEGMTPPTVAGLRVALGAATLLVVLRASGQRLPPIRTTIDRERRAAEVGTGPRVEPDAAQPPLPRLRTRRRRREPSPQGEATPDADRRDRAFWWSVLGVGIVGNALPFTLLAFGEQRITSALTAVLNASTPLFTALASAVVLRERLHGVHAAGLGLGLLGVAVAAGLGAGDLADSSLVGAGAAVAASAGYGLAFAWMRKHLVGHTPAVASTGQLLCASVVLAPFALVTSITGGFSPTWTRVAAIVLLGVVGTGAAYLLNYRIVAEVGATRASLVTYLVPVVAVTVGIIVLDEVFTWRLLAGGLLIVAGIAAVHDRVRLARRPPPVPAGVASVAGVAAVVLALAGCGNDPGTAAANGVPTTEGGDGAPAADGCRPEVREAIDPGTSQHVLGDDDTGVEYLSDPPTSGPHLVGPLLSGVLEEPLSRPRQVGQLEGGGILVQHRDLDAAALAELESVAGPDVAVAPNPDLPASIVATAWLTKQTCDTVDVTALRAFVAAHLGRGPETD